MRFYVINLLHRTDRLAHFTEEYNREVGDRRIDDSIVVMQAIDGRTHTLTDTERKLFTRARFLQRRNAPYVIACNLSHLYILQDVVAHKLPYAVVFEDDAVLVHDFRRHLDDVLANMPEDAEFVSLSLHLVAMGTHFQPWPINGTYDFGAFIESQTTPAVGRMKHDKNPCTLAYIVTYKGACNYLQHVYSHGVQDAADYNLHNYLRARNIFYASLKVLCTGNDKLTSNIQV